MKEKFIFKCFSTPYNKYVYDRHTDTISHITTEEFNELQMVEEKRLAPSKSPVFIQYQKMGLFQENMVTEILHPDSFYIEHHINNLAEQLILQVTQQCNLRCSYCAYGDLYYNRKHANIRMDLETAKSAIDFWLPHVRDSEKYTLSFYGGEPLLELGLIKKCVDYMNSVADPARCNFNLTTNGTLITDSIMDFFVENNFAITVSLDGSQKEHDANRKFANGKGSFDTIIGNIVKFEKRYPEYVNDKVNVNTVINPNNDLECVQEYFKTSEIFNDDHIIFSSLNDSELVDKSSVNFSDRFYIIRRYEHMKALLELCGEIDRKALSPLVRSVRTEVQTSYQQLSSKSNTLGNVVHPGGPCIPGQRRLFVTVHGKFFPCERVSENKEYMSIGSIKEGFNIDHIKKILNIGKLTEDECKNCWNLNHCRVCAGNIDCHNDKLCKEYKLECCNTEKASTKNRFLELCILHDLGYEMPQEGDESYEKPRYLSI